MVTTVLDLFAGRWSQPDTTPAGSGSEPDPTGFLIWYRRVGAGGSPTRSPAGPAGRSASAGPFAVSGAPLSINLTGPMPRNVSAAYSDYHVPGNPAGNATPSDESSMAGRFRVARRPALPVPEGEDRT